MSTHAYLLTRTDSKTLSRAQDCIYGRKVRDLSQGEKGCFFGRVAGSQNQTYNCSIYTEPGPLGPFSRITRTYCSCPVGHMCKHAVACFLLIQSAEVTGAASIEAQSSAALPPPARLPAKKPPLSADAWLKMTTQAMATDGMTSDAIASEREALYASTSKQRIVYVLSVKAHPKHGDVVRLMLFRGTRSATGTYARIVPLRELGAKVMLALDDAAFTQLDSVSVPAPVFRDPMGMRDDADGQICFMVRGPGAYRALQAVARTGRLRMDQVDGPTLAMASPRWATLAWQRDKHLSQKLSLVLEPAATHLMFEDAPYYIDVDNGALGRVVTNVHPELLSQLHHAPPIRPEDVAAFAASIPEALAAQLPPPEVLPVRDVEASPTVRLAVRHSSSAAPGAGQTPHMFGELQYSYAGAEVSSDLISDAIYVQDAQGISRIKRQREQEQAARQKLIDATGVKQAKAPDAIDLGPCADKQAFFAMSENILETLKADGWNIDVAPAEAREIVYAEDNPDATMQQSSRGGWFELDMGIVVDNKRIALPPLLLRLLHDPAWGLNTAALAASGRKTVFVPINDTEVVSMPTDRIIELLGMLESLGDTVEVHGEGVLRLPMSDAHLLLDLKRRDKLQLMAPEGLARLAQVLRDSATPPAVAPPKGLNATLRGYQCVGMSWLQMLRQNALGGILADDMGLGKTLQTLAHLLVEKNAGRLKHKALIVCPTSVLGTWVEACERFTPELGLKLHHGPQRHYQGRDSFDILVTTYGTLLRDAEVLSDAAWSIYVLDEAQMVKNAVSKSYIAVCRIEAEQHIALTGTPLENGLRELWALANWAMPGLLGTRRQFEQQFVKPIEVGADVNRRAMLVSRLRPFLMRRTKAQVVQELPEKTDIIEHVELAQKQRDLYEIVRASLDSKVRAQIKEKGMARSMLTVLDALLKLRQVCCDPRLVKDVKLPNGVGSAKLERLFEFLPDLIDSGRRILIFSQFTSMLELIATRLQAMEVDYLTLTGRTRKREETVRAFRAGRAPIFLISLKAGGTGLNLPEADTVIHYDPWWNPAVEDQATSRAHRMGQHKAVFVYKLVVEGSVEAKILKLQDHKRSLFAALMEGKDLAGKLTEKDIDSLLAPLA